MVFETTYRILRAIRTPSKPSDDVPSRSNRTSPRPGSVESCIKPSVWQERVRCFVRDKKPSLDKPHCHTIGFDPETRSRVLIKSFKSQTHTYFPERKRQRTPMTSSTAAQGELTQAEEATRRYRIPASRRSQCTCRNKKKCLQIWIGSQNSA